MTRASTVPDLLRARARRRPEREHLRFEGASATYAEVEERSNRLGAIVVPVNVGHGTRDLGDVYRDRRGHYHVVGLLKDMIRRGGETVAAAGRTMRERRDRL